LQSGNPSCILGVSHLQAKVMFSKIRAFFRQEDGVSAIEYGLIAALIAVAIVVTVGFVGTALDGVFNEIKTSLAPTK
jgi:pilus assembly protein Flp/PilA